MPLNFLHITDVHHGTTETAQLYGTVRKQFTKDLEGLLQHGPCDLVLVTGDVAFSGSDDQYAQFDTEVLEPLLAKLSVPGAPPPLVLAVPGNHDLVRVAKTDDKLGALLSWHEREETREGFWKDLTWHRERFAPYLRWWQRTRARATPGSGLLDLKEGKLAGEFCATVERGGVKIAVVGLNTAFLHLNGEFGSDDGPKRLALTLDQWTGPFPSSTRLLEWLDGHAIRILLTHHPADWLHPHSKQTFESEIAEHFDLHLCGHVHTAGFDASRRGGSSTACVFKGASLFGVEKLPNGQQRIHGYAWGRCDAAADPPTVEMFPRLAYVRQDNTRGLGADHSFDLDPRRQSFFAVGAAPRGARRASGNPSAPAPELLAAQRDLALAAAQIRSLVEIARRLGVFYAESAQLDDAAELHAAFLDAHRLMLCDMQAGVADRNSDRIDVDVLELQTSAPIGTMELVHLPPSTSLAHQLFLAEMYVRIANGDRLEAIGDPPGVAAWVLAAATHAASEGLAPGVAIASDVHSSADVMYHSPRHDAPGYLSRPVPRIYKPKALEPPYRCLMAAPIYNTIAVIDDPATPELETTSAAVGVINFTSMMPGRFTERDVTWARACASMWGQLWAVYTARLEVLMAQ